MQQELNDRERCGQELRSERHFLPTAWLGAEGGGSGQSTFDGASAAPGQPWEVAWLSTARRQSE